MAGKDLHGGVLNASLQYCQAMGILPQALSDLPLCSSFPGGCLLVIQKVFMVSLRLLSLLFKDKELAELSAQRRLQESLWASGCKKESSCTCLLFFCYSDTTV